MTISKKPSTTPRTELTEGVTIKEPLLGELDELMEKIQSIKDDATISDGRKAIKILELFDCEPKPEYLPATKAAKAFESLNEIISLTPTKKDNGQR